jgi:sulfur carrier protein ThiS
MKIQLNLYASLTRYLPHEGKGNSCTVALSEGTTVDELLSQLEIPSDAVKLIFLNGVHATGDEILKDGGRVGVFPPIGGG